MASAAARAPSPETRKAGTATVPTSANLITNNSDEYNLISKQAQRLSRLFGIADRRARLIASLAYEVRS